MFQNSEYHVFHLSVGMSGKMVFILRCGPDDRIVSLAKCKKDVTPLLTHWSYVFLALTHRCGGGGVGITGWLVFSADCTIPDKLPLTNPHE